MSLKPRGSFAVLIFIIIVVAIGAGAMVAMFILQKDNDASTYWRDEDYEQIVVGTRPTNETMNNTSVNLRSPIRKVYVSTNSNYTPTWTRENTKNFKRTR